MDGRREVTSFLVVQFGHRFSAMIITVNCSRLVATERASAECRNTGPQSVTVPFEVPTNGKFILMPSRGSQLER